MQSKQKQKETKRNFFNFYLGAFIASQILGIVYSKDWM